MYIMKKQGDNMNSLPNSILLSELVNEVNQEQELSQLCDKLCDDLLTAHLKQYPTLTDQGYTYEVGRKYIKIISYDVNQRCVWGFINKGNTNFNIGDVFKAAGWGTPALNAARGNLFDGYAIFGMRKYGPDYLR
jgi:hypothetical protein